MEIFKFGGAALQNPTSISQFGTIICSYKGNALVIVVSAMGKVTRALETILEKQIHQQSYEAAIEDVYTYHLHIIQSLWGDIHTPLQQELNDWKKQIHQDLHSTYQPEDLEKLYSQIVAWGEILSSRITYHYLLHLGINCTWVDARKYIKTKVGYINAQVDQTLTRDLVGKNLKPLLQHTPILLTQGFIGSDAMGHTTTLGKEGSDYTGAILAAALGAQSLTIWKDVPGIMNADPKIFQEAKQFKELSYETMAAMSFYGAQVVHPKTIYPLALQDIPLHIRPFSNKDAAGTIVSNHHQAKESSPLPVYVLRTDQVWMKLQVEDFCFFEEKQLAIVFEAFDRLSLRINFLERTPYHIAICLTYDYIKLEQLLSILQPIFKVEFRSNVSLLTIMGQEETPVCNILEGVAILAQQRYQSVCQIAFYNYK
jgi:aspartate kinase